MKIALIGAGSSRLPLMLASIARAARATNLSEVALYDARPERVVGLMPVGRALASECGPLPHIVPCATALQALEGADVLILTARPGFEAARARDERVCLDFGVIGQETTGPAGFAFAARSIPVAIEYGRLALSCNPRCLIVVFMNPAGMVTQALRQVGIETAIGVCDSASVAVEAVARWAGVLVESTDFRVVGLNHLSWTCQVRMGDRDLLAESLEDEGFLRRAFPWFDSAFLRDRGYIPNEYLVYFYRTEEVLTAMRREPHTRGEVLAREHAALFRDLQDHAARGETGEAILRYARYLMKRHHTYLEYARLPGPAEEGGSIGSVSEAIERLQGCVGGYAEVAMDVLLAMRGARARRMVLNVPAGQTAPPGLDREDVVEVTCEVGPDGAQPLLAGEWPLRPEDLHLVMRVKEYERLAIRAIIEDSSLLAEEALVTHPLVARRDLARRLVSALFSRARG